MIPTTVLLTHKGYCMKKLFSLLLAALLLFSLTACGEMPAEDESTASSESSGENPDSPPADNSADSDQPQQEQQPATSTVYCCTEEKHTSGESGYLYTRTYDEKGNKLTESQARQTGEVIFNYAYTYDAAGNCLTETCTDKDGLGYLCAYTYDEKGNLIKREYGNLAGGDPIVTDYTYDEAGKLIAEHKLEQGGLTLDYTYTYDEAGRLLKKAGTVTGADGAVVQETLEEYTYDAAGNKLSHSDHRGYKEEWTYDGQGNVLSRKELDKSGKVTIGELYTYDEHNRVLTESYCTDDVPKEIFIYDYDQDGYLLTKSHCFPDGEALSIHRNYKYTYDDANNLVSEVASDVNGVEYSRKEYKYIAIELPNQ